MADAPTGRILLAEDERPLAKALELKFKSAGFDITVVGDGQKAIDALAKNKYDLVLTDLIMPNVDGFGLLEYIKAHKIHTKVIVLSNLGQQEDKERVSKLGAVGYYVKADMQLNGIVENVRKLLGG